MKKISFSLKLALILTMMFYARNIMAQSLTRVIYGKIYYQAKGKQYPASYKRIVIMPNNSKNLALAQDLYNLFEDSTIKKISGARTVLTSKDGNYEFRNTTMGSYIIRVTGMGGMVIKFEVSSDSYISKKIPDMPADYYNKRLDYMQKN
jgi:hypothetical protein